MTNKNLYKYIIIIAISLASGLADATPETIRAHPDYKSAKTMIEKQGREATINYVVSLQKEIMRKHGGHIDDYTEVVGIIGHPYGMHQKLELKVEEMLRDLNENRTNKGKKPISRERLIKEIQEGGVVHANQVRMLCSTPGSRAAIDGGIDYTMAFYDKKMTFLGDIKVNSPACLRIELLP